MRDLNFNWPSEGLLMDFSCFKIISAQEYNACSSNSCVNFKDD